MQKVYLAGPITGLSYGETTDWREEARRKLFERGIDGMSPMRGKEFLNTPGNIPIQESYDEILQGSTAWINTRDYNDVRRADALLVNFVGAKKVSIGTVLEIGAAKALNKPIIIVMEEDNIHNHVMISHGYVVVVPTLEIGIKAIIDLIG